MEISRGRGRTTANTQIAARSSSALLWEDRVTEPREWTQDDIDYDMGLDDCCPNCGGEGVVYSCFEEWACIDPEGGCDLCEHRCDWCQPRKLSVSLPSEQLGGGK